MMKIYKLLFMMCLMLASWSVSAQQRVTGKVIDETGMEVIGASVFIQNTTIGTITDYEGNYAFSAPDSLQDANLVISFIGYATQIIPMGGKTRIDVSLELDNKQLEEVIVVGYSTQTKSDVTGALASVKGKDLNALPVAGIDQALQGRAPGVNISQVTGAPGEGVSVRIRGIGSLNSSNDPLYVVDGVPTREVLNILSPQDIEEITILKDASAAALYGSRANNGVVLITTKKGSKDRSMITINSQVGVQTHGKLTEMTNRDQYIEMYNEAANNDNAFVSDDLFKRALITDEIAAGLPDENHLEAIFRTAVMQNYGITASGGNDKTQYLLSMTYFDQEGIIIGSDYDRLSGRINLNTKMNDWFTTGLNLNVSRSHRSIIGSSGDGAGGNGGSIVRYAFFRTPAIPIYDENGDYVDLPQYPGMFGDGYNPVGLANYSDNNRTTDRYFGKVFGIVRFAENLRLTSNFGFDSEDGLQRRFDRNWGSNDRINNPNRLNVQNNSAVSWTNNNVLQFDKKLDSHRFSVLVGSEAIKTEGYFSSQTGRDFPDQDPNLVYLGNGMGEPAVSEGRYAFTLLSFFGKVDYDFNDKYQFSASVRRDGSSRFASENKWGTFYAVSGGWNLHKEAFLENVDLISQLKLRVGYGEIGNQEIGNYAYSDLISPNYNYPFTGTSYNDGYAVTQLGNNQVKWESSNQFNTGVDFEIKQGVLYGSVDYYYKLTTDMLVKAPNPASAGYASAAWVNNGEILNEGIELLLGFRKTYNDFSFNISGNGAYLHNEVLSMDGFISGGAIGSNYTTRTEEGHSIGSFYMYEMEGIFQNQLDISTSAYQGSNIRPGDVKYKDQNGDNYIDEKDRTHVGSPIPKFTAGLNLMANYKNFDATLFFQGAYGFDIYNVAFHDIEGFYRPFNLTKEYYDNRWTGEGTSNEYPRASWSGSNNNTRISTRFLRDGSYTRLKNVQVGYNFPQATLDKLHLTRLRVYVSAQNLLTFTKYYGLDPEMTTSDNATSDGDMARSIDWGTYPSARSYNIGVNLSF
ncbi:SusC/RagA family TonB-linked outer membrane protein [Marinoscillum pacificum]|uniref:SusC/RagA family TonB-linked outer membrane protein n=1 Tax=Marinoscillum pacificum TaxID=392723 RepID=UPI0021571E90|nr:TonB-dependent receptor [Marinoscillum pacificum]